MSASRFHLSERKRIQRSRSKTFQPFVSSILNITLPQSQVAVMSTSTEKLSSSPENADVEKRNLGTKINEKGEMQKDEEENLQCILARELYPEDLRSWPIFSLLEPEFIPQIHTVVVYGNLGNGAIIVTKDKNVYNLGFDKDDCSTAGDKRAFCLKKIEELCGKNLKTFAHNSYFILALTEEGEVYYWKFINYKSGVEESRPTRVAGLSEKRIVDIACGSSHSLALTSDGKVYAWGENNFGQVGNENTAIFNGSVPRQVKHELEKKNVIHIACGLTFNMVVTDENKLYGWGNNESGQISSDNTSFSMTTFNGGSTDHRTSVFTHSLQNSPMFGSSSNSKNLFGCSTTSINNVQSQKHYVYPREITYDMISSKIVKVACGYEHTLALTNNREVFAWGKNHIGQLGGNYNMQSSRPIKVNTPKMREVLDIAAHGNLSVAEGSDRTIYVWGDYFGQCITTPFRTTFSRIHDPFAYNSCRVMHKPLTVSTNIYEYAKEVLKIVESLGTGFDDPSTSDFTIQVEGQSIHVHKVILKRRCQYFKKMFEGDWTEIDQNFFFDSMLDLSPVYTVSDKFSYIVYKAFLKYLYTGKIDLPAEKTLELMKLADLYNETNLKKNCSQIIKQAITVSNVAFFYNEAIKYNAKELEESCLQYAFSHLTAVVESEDFAKLDVNTILKFLRKAANGNVFKT
ncbi:RCC1 and BTB domain-containing protein 1-like isoform X1 [Camponotus floridanus]|uniref:RCC1 and BTB domain-containing protein 1-like isoform X1 n=2 Tax=Camponotus floridanus TaxID=104421 RepID=UPI000DC6CEDF|nr:RCC1 and BTB domain-containing protein 1-like isoform X1 [Camponotus floridanus]